MTDDIWNDDGAWIALLVFFLVFGDELNSEEETAQRLG